MAEKLTAAPSDTSRKQNIENFENCDTASDIVNYRCNQINLSPDSHQQEQE